MNRRHLRWSAGAALAVVLAIGGGAGVASAHPLGNFSVNHAHALTFHADRVIDDAVVDIAEIPTAQQEPTVDTDGDGTASAAELQAHGAARCSDLAAAVVLTVDGVAAAIAVTSSSFAYADGQAGLPVSRLECRLEAVVDLRTAATVEFVDDFQQDRVGWREITAVGDGARLVDSPVPTDSPTDGLRTYPDDLLSSPLVVHTATFDVVPGTGQTLDDSAAAGLPTGGTGFFSGVVDRVNTTFNDLIGHRDLTLGVGLLAVALALVLGASHALLPGHGKTVMAAYIAGRQGSVRDAVVVGATVTGTHTGGVLVLGLALTLSASLTGESVLSWLGVASGLLVATLGLALLIGAARHRGDGHGHRHGYRFAGHDHDHDHGHGHGHGHGDGHTHAVPASVPGLTLGSQRMQLVQTGSSVATLELDLTSSARVHHDHHDHGDAHHDHAHHDHGPTRVSRRGLIGMGIAGGLVPSPSALVILLSAIALGRTAFGILLVVGYGVGMAATLTLAGVLLVKVRDRLDGRWANGSGRARRWSARWNAVMPYATATLVLIVGLGLAVRSVSSI